MEGRELPVGWTRCLLGDVVDYGKTHKAEPSTIPDQAWVLELEDIEKDSSRLLERLSFAERKSKSTKNVFNTGDVLYGKLRPYLNKVIIADRQGFCSTEIIPLPPGEALEAGYLFYWLKSPEFLAYTSEVSHGINMPRLGTEAGRNAPFVLAPLIEQHRIAAKLDTTIAAVEASRQRLDGVAAILKRFRQAVLAAATTGELTREWREENARVTSDSIASGSYLEPAALPENYQRLRKKALVEAIPMWPDLLLPSAWSIQSIGNLYKANYIIDFADGNHGSLYPRESDFGDDGVRFLTASQVSDDGSIAFEDCPLLGFQKACQLVKGWSKTGDVILTHNATVGRCALIDEEIEPFLLGTSATFYRFNSDFIQPGYAWLLFSSPFFQDQLRACMEQTTRNQVPITKQTTLGFILPPILEQVEIWRRSKELFALAGCLEAKLIAARKIVDHLPPALLAKAFCGELMSQDPSEEPASVLVDRIRANRQVVISTGGPVLRRRSSGKASHTNSTLLIEMLSRNDVMHNHLSAILRECGPLSAEALWSASQLEIDDFYDQLRDEEAQGFLREKRGDSPDSPRLLESAA